MVKKLRKSYRFSVDTVKRLESLSKRFSEDNGIKYSNTDALEQAVFIAFEALCKGYESVSEGSDSSEGPLS